MQVTSIGVPSGALFTLLAGSPSESAHLQAPWPHLEALAEATAASGKALVPRCISL